MALKPSNKPTKPVADDEADEARPVSTPDVENAEEALPEVTTKKPVAPAAAPAASSAEVTTRVDVSEAKKDDKVLITMFEDISPAPTVGTYSIPLIHGLKELKARKNYRFPKFVAEVLVDAKKAEFLQVG